MKSHNLIKKITYNLLLTHSTAHTALSRHTQELLQSVTEMKMLRWVCGLTEEEVEDFTILTFTYKIICVNVFALSPMYDNTNSLIYSFNIWGRAPYSMSHNVKLCRSPPPLLNV